MLLTTQYLDEAVSSPTPSSSSTAVWSWLRNPSSSTRSGGPSGTLPDLDAAALERVRSLLGDEAEIHGLSVTMPASNGLATLSEVVAQLERLGLPIYEVGLEHPSLDEVFSTVTGHSDGDGLTARATEKDA
jgi:ABC-2 type transport system ATP-binding protein